MRQIDWDKWANKLQKGRLHIVLEGGDNAGKSTFARAIQSEAGHHLKNPIMTFSNPCDSLLYHAIKSGDYDPFAIAMMTMNEQIEIVKLLDQASIFDNALLIQDRHACISGYCYNMPYMDGLELDTYTEYRNRCSAANLNECIVVIIDTDRPIKARDMFEEQELQSTARLRYKHAFEWTKAKIVRVHNYQDDNLSSVLDAILQGITEKL